MKIYFYQESLPEFKKAVLTIGTFDGVHLGHCMILDQLKEEAARIGGETVIVTFHPHPRRVIHQDKKPVYLLNSIQERISLLESHGIHNLVVIPFTETFSEMKAEAYVEEFLVGVFHPHTIIIGYDHRFGKDRKGDYQLLEKYSANGYFRLLEIPERVINNSSVSSTRIREALLSGRVEEANSLLGYPFFFEGKVVQGNRLGHTLGFPTANLQITDADKIIPANGVYVVRVTIHSHPPEEKAAPPSASFNPANENPGFYGGMMNIGLRPTVDGKNRTIEVHLFDFDNTLYGKILRVQVLHRLREEKKFDSLEELRLQLQRDKSLAIEVLAK